MWIESWTLSFTINFKWFIYTIVTQIEVEIFFNDNPGMGICPPMPFFVKEVGKMKYVHKSERVSSFYMLVCRGEE
jgi:hypothetical protein